MSVNTGGSGDNPVIVKMMNVTSAYLENHAATEMAAGIIKGVSVEKLSSPDKEARKTASALRIINQEYDVLYKGSEALGRAKERALKRHKIEEGKEEEFFKDYLYIMEEYLVNGAFLACTGSTIKDIFIKLEDGITEQVYEGKQIFNFLTGISNASNQGGKGYAKISDAERHVNINPFGNCKFSNDFFNEPIIKNMQSDCRVHGTCFALMCLCEKWDNVVGGAKYNKNEEMEDCINMLSHLGCYRGGIIYPIYSGQTMVEDSEEIVDKYIASESIKIRATPNGHPVDGNIIFKKGAIVKIYSSKEEKIVDGSDFTWIKVYYDGSNVAWVAKELLIELPKPVTGYSFNYNWDKSQYVNQEFKDKAVGVAKSLDIDPDDLMAVMAFESRFNPAQKNEGGSSATGLIQCTELVAGELNTTTAELAKMSGVEQLDYVLGYLYPEKGNLNDLSDLYMSVLCPKAVGESDNYVLYSKGTDEYTSNQPLDSNNDGKITKKEATQAVIDRRSEYL